MLRRRRGATSTTAASCPSCLARQPRATPSRSLSSIVLPPPEDDDAAFGATPRVLPAAAAAEPRRTHAEPWRCRRARHAGREHSCSGQPERRLERRARHAQSRSQLPPASAQGVTKARPSNLQGVTKRASPRQGHVDWIKQCRRQESPCCTAFAAAISGRNNKSRPSHVPGPTLASRDNVAFKFASHVWP